ncbi:MAG TPA: hypothetical protein PK863_00875 [Candidatus Dojkabacteria bacterium]|nr:hypothetical protein [Candidatus Dojkabacteria bacterium]HRP50986.1 hypothetical protein [Candidatus Dojkabacteria bacterium]
MNKISNKNTRDFKRFIFGVISVILMIFFVLIFHFSTKYQPIDVDAARNTITGTYSIIIEEDFKSFKSKDIPVLVKDDKSIIQLGNLNKLPKGTKPGDKIKITGVYNKKAVLNIRSSTLTSVSKSRTSNLSQINVRILPVNLRNNNTNAFTKEQMQNVLNGNNNPISADRFMQKVSKGRFKLGEVKVEDWYKIDTKDIPTNDVCTVYDINTIINHLDEQYNADVYNKNYQSLIFIIDAECYRGGRAVSRFETGQGYIYLSTDAFKEGVIAHEMGHNLDIHHANSYDCGLEMYGQSASCKTKEYGSPFSVMGLDVYDNLFREFNGAERIRAGWLNSSEITKVTQSGKYTIYPLSEVTTQPKVLEIMKSDIQTDERYYIDFRTPTAPFDSIDSDLYDGANVTGVGIQTTFTQTYNPDSLFSGHLRHTQIIDFTPGSFIGFNEYYKDFLDARLTKVGNEYYDKINGIKIKVLSITNQKVELQVDFTKSVPTSQNLITFRAKSSSPLVKAHLSLRDVTTGKYIKVKDFSKLDTYYANYSHTETSDMSITPKDVRISYSGYDPNHPEDSEYLDLLWLEINNTRYSATNAEAYSTGAWNKLKLACTAGYPNVYPAEFATPTRLSCPDKYFQFIKSESLPVKLKNMAIRADCDLSRDPEIVITWASDKNSAMYFVDYCEGTTCSPTTSLDGVPEDSGQDGIRRFYAHIDDPFGLTPPPIAGKTYKYRVEGAKLSNGEYLVGPWSDTLSVTVPQNICN